ncbi:hypothetical protein N7456_011623 [Penicillium angulare]|uniref:Methyltransferase domain-containing protein n=1 Tax=Penicillium angulare TaxID=116970 RepID=A0A9W9K0V3_9EURO|nr:hypothetical protein N7456_011623 [Penicillium angulare]
MAERERLLPQWNEGADISGLLDGDGGRLLQNYSNIEREEMEEHVKRIGKKGWDIMRFPCFRMFLFLRLDLSCSPVYQKILEEIRAGSFFLDMGCGLGQDIRRLILDGAPAEYLVGLDIEPAYIDLGYELFKDRSSLQSRFIVQDLFQDTPEMSTLIGKFRVIKCGYSMHLWNYARQLDAAKRIIQLASPRGGSIITGMHLGSHNAKLWTDLPPEFKAMFLHNKETLSELWMQASTDTGTRWKFECAIEEDENSKVLGSDGCRLRWYVVQE